MTEKKDHTKKETPYYFTPLSSKGWPRWAVYIISIFGCIYLLNPSFGFFELIPDAIPFVGNLDEGAAALAIWYGILEIKKTRKRNKQ